MRDVGNHESRDWRWRDLATDPTVLLAVVVFLGLVVALVVAW